VVGGGDGNKGRGRRNEAAHTKGHMTDTARPAAVAGHEAVAPSPVCADGPAEENVPPSPSQGAKRRGGVLGRWGGAKKGDQGSSAGTTGASRLSAMSLSSSPQPQTSPGRPSRTMADASRTEFRAPGLGHGVIVTDGFGSIFCKVTHPHPTRPTRPTRTNCPSSLAFSQLLNF
jgi:hypothetical protein